MNILITGGAGFIGMNAAERFLKEGWEVTVLDNLSRKGTDINLQYLQGKLPKGLTFVKADIRADHDVLAKLTEEHDVILHLAAQVAVTTSVVNPREDFEINALGTFNVLEVVRQSKRKPTVLFASTNKVYGGLENVPVKEGDRRYAFAGDLRGVSELQPLDFHSPYGCSKGAADQYVRDYSRLYGLKTVVFRQSCIYGPHQLGIEDQGWVAWFMIAAMFNRPVKIYGNGKQVRDLLFIDDLTDLYVRAASNISKVAGNAYNIGGGPENTLSLLEFLELLEKDVGLKLNWSYDTVRPGDQPLFISDNNKILSDLGWKPTTGVSAGIRQLHQWLEENRSVLGEIYS